MTKGRSSQKLGRFFVLGLSNEKGCAKALLKGIHSGAAGLTFPPIVRHISSVHPFGTWCAPRPRAERTPGPAIRDRVCQIAVPDRKPDKTMVSPLAGWTPTHHHKRRLHRRDHPLEAPVLPLIFASLQLGGSRLQRGGGARAGKKKPIPRWCSGPAPT